MKVIRRVAMMVLCLCYLTATIFRMKLWGDLLSPVITFIAFFIVYRAFYWKEKKGISRFAGLFLSLSVLVWAAADVLWAVYDIVLHVNPDKVKSITLLYGLTNVFIAAALAIYIFLIFRKWNLIQMLLDTAVLSYLTIDLVWITFLGENFKNVLLVQSDWISTSSIILDILVAMWIVISFISIRSGKTPLPMKIVIFGAFFYSITDLIYYYKYFFKSYNPNSILDAVYLLSFMIFCCLGDTEVEYGP